MSDLNAVGRNLLQKCLNHSTAALSCTEEGQRPLRRTMTDACAVRTPR